MHFLVFRGFVTKRGFLDYLQVVALVRIHLLLLLVDKLEILFEDLAVLFCFEVFLRDAVEPVHAIEFFKFRNPCIFTGGVLV